jgi:citrate synthase
VWPTAVTDIDEGAIFVRGVPIENLMKDHSFGETLALLFSGRLPNAVESRIIEAVLVLAIDHGATSPSALTARTVVSGGATPEVAAAAGLLALSKYHGAAVQGSARLLSAIVDAESSVSLDDRAQSEVDRYLSAGERIPGFGHRVHSKDPRTTVLLELAAELKHDHTYIDAAYAVEKAVEKSLGRSLPMNLDTGIASVLLPFIPAEMVLGVFMASRFCGVFMQASEESFRMKPMRKIMPGEWVYDGPTRS